MKKRGRCLRPVEAWNGSSLLSSLSLLCLSQASHIGRDPMATACRQPALPGPLSLDTDGAAAGVRAAPMGRPGVGQAALDTNAECFLFLFHRKSESTRRQGKNRSHLREGHTKRARTIWSFRLIKNTHSSSQNKRYSHFFEKSNTFNFD